MKNLISRATLLLVTAIILASSPESTQAKQQDKTWNDIKPHSSSKSSSPSFSASSFALNLKQRSRLEDGTNWYQELRRQMLDETKRQQAVERDHYMMEKWLVDNINDLHRELKQTETDFEHYAQVTKDIIAQNEIHLKQQLAAAAAVGWAQQAPMQIPFVGPIPLNQARKSAPIPYFGPLFMPQLTNGHELLMSN